jgi:two-component system OmpR family sensor kinase
VSLRLRLLLGTGLIAVVLVGVAVAIARTTEAYLVHQVDQQLDRLQGARFLAITRAPDGTTTLPVAPPQGIRGEARSGQAGSGEEARPSEMFLGVLAGDGTVDSIFLPNVGEVRGSMPALDPQEVVEARDEAPFTTGAARGDERFRVRVFSGPDGTVAVAALPLDDVDEAVSRLVTVEVIATVAVLGVLALVAWWVIRLGVRPINQMAHAATVIAAGDLSHRVPQPDPRTEAGELGGALNTMLGRIEAAFEEQGRAEDQLRSFLADASHELRTPVTTIRGYAELYRAGALDEPDRLRDAMRRTEEEAVRMGGLVDGMLELARLDKGRPIAREAVDLAAVARDAGRDAQAVEPTRPLAVLADDRVFVRGDPHGLHQVAANLVGNALAHTAPGTPVSVRVTSAGAEAWLEVADAGPGMRPEVASRVFERFFRADPARTRGRSGSGLGLSIVQAVVTAHDGRVEVDTAPGTGTTVRVRLPLLAGPDTRLTANSQTHLRGS